MSKVWTLTEKVEKPKGRQIDMLEALDNYADIRCVDCKQRFEITLTNGASSARCPSCQARYARTLGKNGDWHTWVYGGAKNPL